MTLRIKRRTVHNMGLAVDGVPPKSRGRLYNFGVLCPALQDFVKGNSDVLQNQYKRKACNRWLFIMRKTKIYNYEKLQQEAWQFLKFLSFLKILNYVKIIFAYWFSLLLKRPFIWGMPASLSIETSAICNLHCPQCPAGNNELNRQKGLMSFDLFQKIIDDAYQYLISITLHFQGEPLCNPELLNMINYAGKKRIYTILSTNGHYFSDQNRVEQLIKAGLNRIIISYDGATQESYSLYRVGGQLHKVEEGIIQLVRSRNELNKSNPYIVLQTLVFEHNEAELTLIKSKAKQLNADMLQFKSAQFYNFDDNSKIKIPEIKKFSRYLKDENDLWKLKRKVTNRCLRLWQAGVITWDGYVLPCCYDKDADFKYGNIQELSLSKIWKSPENRRFRSTVLKNINKINICQNCNK